jgi:hypothetical protein
VWQTKLGAEARREFKASKMERDLLIIARMLVMGRECAVDVQKIFNEANHKFMEQIQ